MDVSTSIPMDVSISMATGAQNVKPATSANQREVAGYYIIAVSGQQLARILPKEFGGVWQQHAPCSSVGSATPVCPLTSVIRRIVGPHV